MTRPRPHFITPPGSAQALGKPRPPWLVPAAQVNPLASNPSGNPGFGPGFALQDHQHPQPASGVFPKWQVVIQGAVGPKGNGTIGYVSSWSQSTNFGSPPAGNNFFDNVGNTLVYPLAGKYSLDQQHRIVDNSNPYPAADQQCNIDVAGDGVSNSDYPFTIAQIVAGHTLNANVGTIDATVIVDVAAGAASARYGLSVGNPPAAVLVTVHFNIEMTYWGP